MALLLVSLRFLREARRGVLQGGQVKARNGAGIGRQRNSERRQHAKPSHGIYCKIRQRLQLGAQLDDRLPLLRAALDHPQSRRLQQHHRTAQRKMHRK